MSAPLSGLRTAPQGCSHLVLRGAGAGEGRALALPTRSREAAEAPTGPRGPHAQSEAWSPAPVLCAPAGRQGRCPRPAEARSRPGHSQLCGVVLPEVREPRPASLRGRRARHPARGHAARAVALARLVGRFPAPRAPVSPLASLPGTGSSTVTGSRCQRPIALWGPVPVWPLQRPTA